MRKKNTKRAIATYAMVSALVLSATGTPVKAAGQWEETNGAWKYTNEGKPMSGWQSIGGCWYAFDTDGSMKTGWVASDEKWYFMGQSGVMQESGWVSADGADYYLKGTGVMATDFIKDGYELDSTGKAVPMGQTKSVEFTENMDLSDKTIEGNLYIDAAKFKELELSGITVTGKVVILGNNIKDSKITIKDSTVNTISTQGRNAEIILSGKTTVDTIQMEENASVKPAEGYTGKVATIEIQSTAKNEVKVEVPAKTVTSNTFSPVSINAPIDNLSVNKKTDLKVNANVDNITVTKSATDTKVEVEKDATVGSIESDTKVDVGGAGKVEDVKGDDVVNETEKPSKPSTGGGSTGGGSTTPPVNPPVTPDPTGTPVSSTDELKEALASATTEIYLKDSFELTEQIFIDRTVKFNGNDKKLTAPTGIINKSDFKSMIIVRAEGVEINNLEVQVNQTAEEKNPEASDKGWQGYYAIQVYNTTKVVLDGVTVSGADGGILVNRAEVELRGTITVTGNDFGGIEVYSGVEENKASLTAALYAELINETETSSTPTVWSIGEASVNDFSQLFSQNITDEGKIYYYLDESNVVGDAYVTNEEELVNALADSTISNIIIINDIALTKPLVLSTSEGERRTLRISGGNKELTNNTLTFDFAEQNNWDYLIQVGNNSSQNDGSSNSGWSGMLSIDHLNLSYKNSISSYVSKGIELNNVENAIIGNVSIDGAKESLSLVNSYVDLVGKINFGDVKDANASAIMIGLYSTLRIDELTVITNENESKNKGATISVNTFDENGVRPGELIDASKKLEEGSKTNDFHNYYLDLKNDPNADTPTEPVLMETLIPATVVEPIETPTTEEIEQEPIIE